MRLIDADAFLEEARNRIDMQDEYLPIHIKYFVIDEMPTIDAEPIRYGEWIGKPMICGYSRMRCSVCDNVFLDNKGKWNYCPHCGARMVNENENAD